MTRPSFCSLLLALSLSSLAASEQNPTVSDGPIVVQNSYWAEEGLEEEVYQHRLYASRVRAGLGLYVGRVLRRVSDSKTQPDVIWECEYPSMAARQADLEALSASGDFEPVMETMGTLIRRFDRALWRVAESPSDSGSR